MLNISIKFHDNQNAKNLINLGVPIDGVDKDEYSPLQKSILVDNYEMFKFLLKKGVQINAVNNSYGDSALITAVTHHKFYAADKLLKIGANPNLVNKNKESALMIAAAGSELFEELLNYQVNCNARDNDGNTALHLATLYKVTGFKYVQLLLKKGANIDAKNNHEEVALHLAVKEDNYKVVIELLENNTLIDPKDKNGNTPLMLAINLGHEEMVRILLKNNACVNCKNLNNMSPLNFAYELVGTEIITMLLNKGANIDHWPFKQSFLHKDIIHTDIAHVIGQHLTLTKCNYYSLLKQISKNNPYLHKIIKELKIMKSTTFIDDKSYFDLLIEPCTTICELINEPNIYEKVSNFKQFPISMTRLILKYELAVQKLKYIKKGRARKVQKLNETAFQVINSIVIQE